MVHGIEVRSVVLPQAFGKSADIACAEADSFRPDAIVMYGATPRNDLIRIERFAINVMESSMGDDSRVPVSDRPIVAGGPAAYETTLPFRELVRALDSANVRARLSYSAGQHLCNEGMYRVLHHLAITGRASVPCGFVHVPFPAEFGHGIVEDESGMMRFSEIRRGSMAIAICLASMHGPEIPAPGR